MPSQRRLLVLVVCLRSGALGISSTEQPLRTALPKTQPRLVTYSNPLGATLCQLTGRDTLYLAERPFYPRLPGLRNTDVGGKAAIVKLRSGGLFVHSPCQLDGALKKELAALGPVEHVVSPNSEHVSFAQDWIEAFPDATSYAAPGLKERFPGIRWQFEIGDPKSTLPEPLASEFDVAWIEPERAPFKLLGDRPFFSEIVLCHRPSRALLVTDLWWNYPRAAESPAGLPAPALWKFAMDHIYRPVYNTFMRQPGHDDLINRILAWDWDLLLPCHGEPIQGPDAKARLQAFFDL
mmetsp:Transcript_6576/g.20528  ORF Transcript_6576/g.20528 Transcript_6576/m.20528 type:complete len:293 (-) Transcript_6576:24-902(-)